jgi:hypothetical protein
MWFGMLLDSVSFCTNGTSNVPVESVGETFIVNFPETVTCTRGIHESIKKVMTTAKYRVITEKGKLNEIEVMLEQTLQKSLRRLEIVSSHGC